MDHDAHKITRSANVDSINSYDKEDKLPIIIERHVWIAHSVSIKKGVSIRENSVIGANSVVTKSCSEPNSLYLGIPAQLKSENIYW